jgi:ketosteroid isomerase-like protein
VPHRTGLLTRAYEAFHRGDLEHALEAFADDIRWSMPAADGLPAAGVFHGKDEIRWMFAQIRRAYGDRMNARPVEFVEDGRTVVAIGHLEGGPQDNGFRVPYTTIWRFNDDDVPNRAMTLFDTAVVRDALRRETP